MHSGTEFSGWLRYCQQLRQKSKFISLLKGKWHNRFIEWFRKILRNSVQTKKNVSSVILFYNYVKLVDVITRVDAFKLITQSSCANLNLHSNHPKILNCLSYTDNLTLVVTSTYRSIDVYIQDGEMQHQFPENNNNIFYSKNNNL